MNNAVALSLAAIIVGCLLADSILNSGANILFLAKKFAEFTEWLAFWR